MFLHYFAIHRSLPQNLCSVAVLNTFSSEILLSFIYGAKKLWGEKNDP